MAPPHEKFMSFMSFEPVERKNRFTEILFKAWRAAKTTVKPDAMMQEDIVARRTTVHPWDGE